MTLLVKIGRALGIVLVATMAWLGVNGISEFQSASTALQRVAAATHLTYGIAAIAAVFGLLLRQRWTKWALWAWGICATLTGGLAPVVWGGARWTISLLSGVATTAICLAIVWLCSLEGAEGGDRGNGNGRPGRKSWRRPKLRILS